MRTLPTIASNLESVPYSVAARELMRNTLLDAAYRLLLNARWADVRMTEIAHTAGLSRQTLYKEFGSRDRLAGALATREADRLMCALEMTIDDGIAEPARAVADACDILARTALENPVIHAMIHQRDADEALTLLAGGVSLVERTAKHVTHVLLLRWPGLSRKDVEIMSECMVCLAIGCSALAKSPITGKGESAVARLLGPYVEDLFAKL
jgi:AcrR family transcriptional regulator